MKLPQAEELSTWHTLPVVAADGTELGRCAQTYTDAATGEAEWLLLAAADGTHRFVPLMGAEMRDSQVRIAYSETAVLASPEFGTAQLLGPDDESRLRDHYAASTSTAHRLMQRLRPGRDSNGRADASAFEEVGEQAAKTSLLGAAALVVLTVLGIAYFKRSRSLTRRQKAEAVATKAAAKAAKKAGQLKGRAAEGASSAASVLAVRGGEAAEATKAASKTAAARAGEGAHEATSQARRWVKAHRS